MVGPSLLSSPVELGLERRNETKFPDINEQIERQKERGAGMRYFVEDD